jgi:hypothetical protein
MWALVGRAAASKNAPVYAPVFVDRAPVYAPFFLLFSSSYILWDGCGTASCRLQMHQPHVYPRFEGVPVSRRSQQPFFLLILLFVPSDLRAFYRRQTRQ